MMAKNCAYTVQGALFLVVSHSTAQQGKISVCEASAVCSADLDKCMNLAVTLCELN